jgi:hypothetical protein
VIGSLHARHRAIEFKKFLQTLDREIPAELEVHVILDGSSTHKTPGADPKALDPGIAAIERAIHEAHS